MRIKITVLLSLAAFIAGCIPIGVTPDKSEIVWEEGTSRIERRSLHDNFVALLSPEGAFKKAYFLRSEYWFVNKDVAERLAHVQESDTPDRDYLPRILGDENIQKWVFIAHHITSRERADMFLEIFDRRSIVNRITIPGCHRDFSFGYYTPEHYSLTYERDLKAVRFRNDVGEGYVDLVTGAIKYKANKAVERTPAPVMPVACAPVTPGAGIAHH